MVTVAEPLSHVLPEASEALTVTDPGPSNVASPPVEFAKVSSDVSLEVQVALLATSVLLLSVAVNCAVPAEAVTRVGLMVSVWALPPVVVPVIEP